MRALRRGLLSIALLGLTVVGCSTPAVPGKTPDCPEDAPTSTPFGEASPTAFPSPSPTPFETEDTETEDCGGVSPTAAAANSSSPSLSSPSPQTQAPSSPSDARLVVIKHVINDNGESSNAGDFVMEVIGRGVGIFTFPGEESPGTSIALGNGPFSVSESGPSGYGATMAGDCSGIIHAGETLTCTITNDDREPSLGGDQALTGTIEYERTSEYVEDEPGQPHWARKESMSATIDVSMNRDIFDDNVFVDDGSTYEVDRSTHEERQNGECMAIFDTRSLGSYAFTDRPIGPEFENNLTGFIDPASGMVLLTVVITYPYTITKDECNMVSFPNGGASDLVACSANFGIGLEGHVTELPAAPDRVDFQCTDYSDDVMDYDTQTVTVSGELELR